MSLATESLGLLRQVPLFKGLTDGDYEALQAISSTRDCRSGETLIQEGESAGALFILVGGQVEIRKANRPGALARLGRGECVGEMSVVSDERPSVSVVCASDCQLIVLTKADFHELMARNPAVSAGLIRVLVHRLSSANDNVREVSAIARDIETFNKVVGRVANQTHILAINASIESARAGEAGRGFGVVAAEMRNLADEAQKAVESIQRLVAQIKAQA
ncbi:MAG: cyclic nucleotide-binding domain-containing protein [Candidatus Sericytochromatia bacterium]|nr:cyclic nucleotide-binding domain-containing protein [Candidatus Sericytochromatia bacterium]